MPKSAAPKRPPARAAGAATANAASATRSLPSSALARQLGWLALVGAFVASLFIIAVLFPAAVSAVVDAASVIPLLLAALWSSLLVAVISTVGIALPFVIVLLVPPAVWLSRAERSRSERFRWWAAWLLSGLAIFVVFGIARPADTSVAGVSLAEVSAGGNLGRVLAGPEWWEGIGRLAILSLGISALLAPARTWEAFGWLMHNAREGLVGGARGAFVLGSRGVSRWRERRRPVPPLPDEEIILLGETIDPALEPAEFLELPESAVTVVPPAPRAANGRKAAEAKNDPAAAKPAAPAGPPPNLPSLDLLDEAPLTEINRGDIQQRVTLIEETLAAYGVNAKVVQVAEGPTVTQFGVEPGWDIKQREVKERDVDGRMKLDKDGKPKVRFEEVSRTRVKVNRVTALANDLALALAAPTIRIEAPVPGKPVIGIEVPNRTYSLVTLRSVIESPSFQKVAAKSKLPLALGQNVAGEPVAADLAKMPHLLIAGSTGSGKSVCLNSVIASILMVSTPADVRMLMIDPKRVELVPYNGIPHLLSPVITDADKVVGVLGWVVKDMDTRYRAFEEAGARNIEGYNKKALERGLPLLPYEVVIIDELADLMMVAADEVERQLCRLAQLARATGIHLIVATQRPSVDVLTGLIKANFPTRISFAVSSQVDSRTILDTVGAEKLLGRGDMLFLPSDAPKPSRVQGNYVSDREIDAIVEFWKATGPPQYEPEIEEAANRASEGEPDAMFEEARRLVEQHPRISVSFLQRKLRIGYNRAARLMDQLEAAGLIEEGQSTVTEDAPF